MASKTAADWRGGKRWGRLNSTAIEEFASAQVADTAHTSCLATDWPVELDGGPGRSDAPTDFREGCDAESSDSVCTAFPKSSADVATVSRDAEVGTVPREAEVAAGEELEQHDQQQHDQWHHDQ